MTATNGIRTEYKIKRLAAALALAIAAMLGSSCLSPARADAAGTSDGNLVIDVPTTVPCALMADGTVVSPSEWKITTSGDAYIASASASGFPANVEWSARTTDLAAAQAGSVQVSGTGDAATVAGPSDPVAAKLAPSAGFEWAFSKLDAGKNADVVGKAAGGTAVLGSVTFTFAKVEPDAFAVYSADDNSLSFYKRAGVPVAGQTFEGKTATEVYTGIETMTSIPGWTQNHFNDIKTVTVYDKGIAPTGTAFWFAGVRNLKTADVSKLDMSRCKTIECMFTDCISLETLDLSGWDTSSLANMSQAFQHCASLTELNVSGWDVSKVTNMQLAFAEDKALGSLDLSTWDNSAATSMKDAFLQMDSLNKISLGSKFKFVGTNGYLPVPSSTYIAGADGKWYDTDGNGYAPADIPSYKAMTYTAVAPKKAFAVYSADDNSLSFYKRSSVPTAGDAFEGKTATEVYEGVEDASYTATEGAPWSGHAADIASVTVEDAGVSPVSTAYWFKGASKLKCVNLAGLDTSQTTCMDGMFDGCSSLETLDLSAMSTRRVASMTAFLGGCDSLAELSIGSEFAWFGDDCYPPTGDWKQGSTGTDYSESDIPANKTDKYTRTKTAFAVYSADDQSLTFYKRFATPAEGGVFEGKTVTGVYTGFETQVYDGHSSNVPWLSYRSNVKTVTVADAGVAPVSTRNWFERMTALKSADISKLDTRNLTTIRGMFDECSALTSLDLSSFDTSAVVDMGFVFENCTSLTSLDLSSFDTRNVTDICHMFYQCKALTSLDLSSFDTSNVVNMREVFMNCESLASLDLSSFDTGNVTQIHGLFMNCESLTSLDLSSFDTRNVTQISHMFDGCKSLTTLDLSSFDTGKVSQMYGAFQGCSALTTLDLSSFDTSNVAGMTDLFDGCESLTSLDLSSFDTHNVEIMSGLFFNCKSLTTLDLSSFDTSNVTSMRFLFDGCSALTTLDLSSFDTRNATDMDYFFRYCDSLERIDLGAGFKWVGDDCYPRAGNWESVSTGKVYSEKEIPTGTADAYVFKPELKSYAVYSEDDQSLAFYKRFEMPADGTQFLGKTATKVYTGFETTSDSVPWAAYRNDIKTVTVVDEGIAPVSTARWFYLFSNVESFDLSKLDTRKVADMHGMFYGCKALKTLDITSFDVLNVEDASTMFADCSSLSSLDMSHFNISKCGQLYRMFDGCSSLKELDLRSFNNLNLEGGDYDTMDNMFDGCSSLEKVSFSENFVWIWIMDSSLPHPNASNIPGADGNWYAESDGIGYAPTAIPSKKADTYYASKDLLPKAFAVYSADDSSLNFYKRAGVPSAGEQFEGKTATAVFTGIETNEYYDDNPWCNYTDEIKTASVVDEGIAPVSTAYWFTSCKNLTAADLTKLDTSNVTRMTEMFHFCSSLAKLEGISSWNTSKVVSMSSMFDLCPLTSLDLSNWDTSNVEYMQSMFSSCSTLTSVGDISNWDTSKVTSISDMFTGCSSLKTLNLSNWDMSNVTKIDGIFFMCSSLTSVGDISGWNTSKVTLMQNVFNGCSKLSASCLNWDVSKVTNHRDFNKNATGVIAPLAWQASSDEGVGDSMIAPLCEDRGNGNTLGVQSKNDNVEATGKTDGEPSADNEAWSSFKTSADDAGATKDASKGNPTLEGETSKESDATTEPESAEKAAMKKSGE